MILNSRFIPKHLTTQIISVEKNSTQSSKIEFDSSNFEFGFSNSSKFDDSLQSYEELVFNATNHRGSKTNNNSASSFGLFTSASASSSAPTSTQAPTSLLTTELRQRDFSISPAYIFGYSFLATSLMFQVIPLIALLFFNYKIIKSLKKHFRFDLFEQQISLSFFMMVNWSLLFG